MASINYGNFNTAKLVLAHIEANLSHHEDDLGDMYMSVEPMANGREKGFVINSYIGGDNVSIGFTEARSSDEIVLYIGQGSHNDFNMLGNVPSDDVFEKGQKRYKHDEHAKAANYILGYFAGKLKAAIEREVEAAEPDMGTWELKPARPAF